RRTEGRSRTEGNGIGRGRVGVRAAATVGSIRPAGTYRHRPDGSRTEERRSAVDLLDLVAVFLHDNRPLERHLGGELAGFLGPFGGEDADLLDLLGTGDTLVGLG